VADGENRFRLGMVFGDDVADAFLGAGVVGYLHAAERGDGLGFGPGLAKVGGGHPVDGTKIVGARDGLECHEGGGAGRSGNHAGAGVEPGGAGAIAAAAEGDFGDGGDEAVWFGGGDVVCEEGGARSGGEELAAGDGEWHGGLDFLERNLTQRHGGTEGRLEVGVLIGILSWGFAECKLSEWLIVLAGAAG
jgi:hypothetical protein